MDDTRVVFDRIEQLLEAIDRVRHPDDSRNPVVAWFGRDRKPLRAAELANIYGDWLAGTGQIPTSRVVTVGETPPSPHLQHGPSERRNPARPRVDGRRRGRL